MEPEGSLECSQDRATCQYAEPVKFCPYLTYNFSNIHFNIILLSMPKSTK